MPLGLEEHAGHRFVIKRTLDVSRGQRRSLSIPRVAHKRGRRVLERYKSHKQVNTKKAPVMSIRLTPVPHALPAAKPPSPQRPLLAPRAGVRGYHSVCNSTLTVAATHVRDFRRRRRRSASATPPRSRWHVPGTEITSEITAHRSCGCRCLSKLPDWEQ